MENGLSLLPLAMISRSTLLLIFAFPLTLIVGFSLGLIYERWYHSSALQRLSKKFEKLFEHVSRSLQTAEAACKLLNQQAVTQQLRPAQQASLQTQCGRLSHQLTLLQQQTARSTTAVTSNSISGKRFRLPKWKIKPIDSRTGLPDQVCYQHNLQQLTEAMQKTPALSAAMFIRLDQFERHQQRSGGEVANQFVKQTGSLILRKLRESDCLCQITDDLLIALLPNVTANEAEQIAAAARQVVKQYVFRHPESDAEILVTASFGYSLFDCKMTCDRDFEQELWNRSQLALNASQRHGRCQLHEVTPAGTSRLVAG